MVLFKLRKIVLTLRQYNDIMKMRSTKMSRKEERKLKISRDKVDICMSRKKMTVQALADAYGVSRSRINVLLNQREVSTVAAGRLAEALGVDVTAILEE
jgi:DNA-binding Xre family transcriptional regulator